MAQFFSAFQPDYGADITARGYNNAANQISGAMMQAAGARYEDASRTKRMQMEATIQQQMQDSGVAKQVQMEAAKYGVQPVIDQATGKMDVYSTAALTKQKADMEDRIRKETGINYELKARNEANLQQKADAYGISRPQAMPDPAAVGAAFNSGQDVGSVPRTIQPTQNLAQLVQAREDERRIEQAKALQDATPSASRYNDRGAFAVNGQYLGNAVRDGQTGAMGFYENGTLRPIPEGAQPMTATALQKSVPSQQEFRKIKGDLTSAEISLTNMDRYIKSVGDAESGLQRLADNYSANMKTLIGEGLDPKELSLKMAQGQMQGLLGANRTNVVGGGVMTEQDALRIIERLGGDVGALSNPQVVKEAISQVYSDRYKQYEDDFNFYNAAVSEYYGSKGFPKAEKRPFGSSFTNDYQPQQETPPVEQVAPIDDILKKYLQ